MYSISNNPFITDSLRLAQFLLFYSFHPGPIYITRNILIQHWQRISSSSIKRGYKINSRDNNSPSERTKTLYPQKVGGNVSSAEVVHVKNLHVPIEWTQVAIRPSKIPEIISDSTVTENVNNNHILEKITSIYE